MFGLKSVVAAMTVATMIGSSAVAAETAPLAPGKPAGVHQANLGVGTGTLLIGLGVVAIVTAIAITVGNQNSNNPAAGGLGSNNTQGVTPATST
jgi:hypothetical protein